MKDKSEKADKYGRVGVRTEDQMSEAQLNPNLCEPEDFKPISEELEFGGACGDSEAEYNRLLKAGRDQKSTTTTPIDRFGRRLVK